MSKIAFISTVLCVFFLFGSCKAVEVADLYLVKWPVKEQNKSARWKATLAGFKEVLIRKSGSKNILQSYNVQQAYGKVTNYLQRFEYSKLDPRQNENPYLISLYFEPRLIDNLIQDAKMPIWGSNRPVTILWLAIEEDFQRRIINQSENSEIEQVVSQSAVRRAVPVITPLMDLDDELAISISDIWGLFPAAITQASARYSADSILFGRIFKDGEVWYGKFGYINGKTEVNFEISNETKEQVINDMTDKLADLLCSKYCVVEETGQKNELIMNIDGVTNFKDFKLVESYLSNLTSIRDTKVVSINTNRVIFKLTLQGQIDSVLDGINLSKKLIAIEPDELQELNSAIPLSHPQENIEGNNEQQLPNDSEGDENIENDKIESNLLEQPELIDGDDSEQLELQGLNKESPTEKSIPTLYFRWIG